MLPTRVRPCAVFLVSILAPVIMAAPVANRSGPVSVRVEMRENAVGSQQTSRCEIEGDISAGESKEWCFFYGEAKAHPETGWEGIRPRSGCGETACSSAHSPTQFMRGTPYVLVDLSIRQAASAGADAQVEATILLRRLTGFTSDGKPSYEESRDKRVLVARQGTDTIIPLPLFDPQAQEVFGSKEIVLRFRVRNLAQWPSTSYGKISLKADAPRAKILLDGGFVGRTTESAPILLNNVAVGKREVVIRDPSGRERHKTVNVGKDGTVEVTLDLQSGGPAARAGLRPLGKNPQGHDEYWREKDGALVVRIPAGNFQMGTAEGQGEPGESPQHEAHAEEFLIDKTEVTWGQFKKFSEATGTPLPETPLWGTPHDYPVTSVLWEEGKAFCEWAGGRLPTEVEWEKAARGTDARLYPWGNEWNDNRCNTRDGGPHRPQPVGMHPACVSPYGVLDMSGNVWEWCADWYDGHSYSNLSAGSKGPSVDGRSNRGGSWLNPASWTRTAFRQGTDPSWRNVLQGFRCAQNPPEEDGRADQRAAGSRNDSAPRQESAGARTDGAPSAATAGHDSTARVPGFEIHVDTVINPKGGGASRQCQASGEVPSVTPKTWWSTVGEVVVNAAGGWEVSAAESMCGIGAFDEKGLEAKAARPPYLIAEMETSVAKREVLMVDMFLRLTSRRFTGFSPEMKPIYETLNEVRVLKLDDWEQAFVPVLVQRGETEPPVGMHEVLLRVRANRVGRPRATAYGVLSVTSDAPGVDVLLDGGVAARTSQEGTAVLRNVPAGERKIGLRAGPGRESASRVVDVVENQTVPVALSLSRGAVSAPANALTPIGKNPEMYDTYRRERDGGVMVRVPEGEFLMGNLQTESNPLPHKVTVSTFLIDKTGVTWGQYEKFARTTRRTLPPEPYWGIHPDHPVVFVTWEEARAYCEWVGGRLPSEAEREKAARGTDERMYPWGNEEPTPDRGVFRHNWGYEASATVGSHPAGASPYGVLDMGGNCWEWCDDWYDPDYYQTSPAKDPTGPRTGSAHVVRGGSWDSRPSVLSSSCRNWGFIGYREGDFGFRCAADPPH